MRSSLRSCWRQGAATHVLQVRRRHTHQRREWLRVISETSFDGRSDDLGCRWPWVCCDGVQGASPQPRRPLEADCVGLLR